jgi:hypothetical protein
LEKLDRVLKVWKPKELRVIAYIDSDWDYNKVGRNQSRCWLQKPNMLQCQNKRRR